MQSSQAAQEAPPYSAGARPTMQCPELGRIFDCSRSAGYPWLDDLSGAKYYVLPPANSDGCGFARDQLLAGISVLRFRSL